MPFSSAPAHDETANGIEAKAPIGRHHGGGARLLDQHRPVAGLARWQTIPIQHFNLLLLAAEDDGAAAARRRRKRAPARLQCWQLRLVAQPPGGETVADDFDGAPGRRPVTRRIDVAELAFDLGDAAEIERHRYRQLEGLSGVTQIEAGGEPLP